MSHREGIIEEMRAYGLTQAEIEGLDVPDPVHLEGRFAFRQGLVEAAHEENPDFPIGLRHMREYHVSLETVKICLQKTSEVAA